MHARMTDYRTAKRKEKRPVCDDVFFRMGLVLVGRKFDVPVFSVFRVLGGEVCRISYCVSPRSVVLAATR